MLKRRFSDPTKMMNIDEGVLKGLSISQPKKVDKPTYEIVGPLERFDGRDTTGSRAALQPGTSHYEEYYARHPEKKASDDRRRERRAMKSDKKEKERVNEQLGLSGFSGTVAVSHPSIVDADVQSGAVGVGTSRINRVEVDAESISRKIKAFALHMGAAKVGITRLNQDWVYTNHVYKGNFLFGEPVELDYEYVICMAFMQDPFMIDGHTGAGVELEVSWKYSYASYISIIVADFIRRLGWHARPLPSMNSPYLVVPTFIDAGIGEYGRCGYVVAKEIGNNWRPGAVATNMPLVTDKPVDFGLQDFCEKCHICAETCPAGAIPKGDKKVVRGIRKWKVDGEKCYDYWTAIGSDCSVCQSVCPWNHTNNLFHNIMREAGERFPGLRNTIISSDRAFYKHKPRPQPRWMANSV
ncbi:4Fe-4S dicluster domain-containing protein [Candidatus Omnitrophota bacterium]